MPVERSIEHLEIVSLYVFEQLRSRERSAWAANEHLQNTEFRRSELNGRAAQTHFVLARVDLKVAYSDDVRNLRCGGGVRGIPVAGPAQDRLDSRDDFPRTKRFGDVVVRAQLQSDDAVHFFRARRQHDDWDIRTRPNLAK